MNGKEHQDILRQAVRQIKNGITEGFETLYILTYQEMYQNILESEQTEKQAEQVLETVYVSAYGRIAEAPEENVLEWLKEILYGLGGGNGTEIRDSQKDAEIVKILSEEKAATIFLRIEEHVGILPKEESEELLKKEIWLTGENRKSFLKIVVSTVLSLAIVIFVFAGLWKDEKQTVSHENKDTESIETAIEEEKVIDPEKTVDLELEENLTLHLADQIFILDQSGKQISSKRDEYFYHEDIQKYEGFTYYLVRNEEIALNDNIPVSGTLIRVYDRDIRDKYEQIDENVRDFIVENGKIYYVKDGILNQKAVDNNFGRREFSYELTIKNNGFYMINEIGEIPENTVSLIQQGNIVYNLENGWVRSVEEALCIYNDIRYSLEDQDGDGRNEICWYTQAENGILIKEGFTIDSFCLADNWIYYSAFEQTDPEDMHYSRIYRIRPDGSAQELVADTFQGNIIHMYYSEERKKIYGEFIPDEFHSYYGKLASISLSGEIEMIDDSEQRAEYQTSGNDRLEFAGIKENQVFCYWYDCQWNGGEDMEIMWKKPIILYD